MNWAPRLKRVFGIEIEQCARCGGHLKVIAAANFAVLIPRMGRCARTLGRERRAVLRAVRPPALRGSADTVNNGSRLEVGGQFTVANRRPIGPNDRYAPLPRMHKTRSK